MQSVCRCFPHQLQYCTEKPQCFISHWCSKAAGLTNEFSRNLICICSHLKADRQIDMITLGEAGLKQGSHYTMRLGSKVCWDCSLVGRVLVALRGTGVWLKGGCADVSDKLC